MKKIIYSAMAVAMLATTSCKDDFAETFVGEEATVEFSISTPEIATRAFSDGMTVDHVHYAIYEVEGQTVNKTSLEDTKTFDNERKVSITAPLKTGKQYKAIFWADHSQSPYTVTFSQNGAKMEVNYTNVECNDERLDAFYWAEDIKIDGAKSINVQLKRPFAQINVGTSDYQAAKDASYEPTLSSITVPVYTTLNLVNGTVEEENATPQTFKYRGIPGSSHEFPVEDNTYDYLAMTYALVGENETADVTFRHREAEGTQEFERTIGSVPLKRNYRTNIYGALLTGTSDITVTINPAYETPDFNEDQNWMPVYDNNGQGEEVEGVLIHTDTKTVTDDEGNTVEVCTFGVKNADGLEWISKNLETKVKIASTRADEDNVYTINGNEIKLLADIDLKQLDNNGKEICFTPIGNYKKGIAFTGVFDGNNHTIRNLSQNTWALDWGYDYKTGSGLGLFSYVKDATIKNLKIDNAYISGETALCGIVAATAYGSCTFENITVTNSKCNDYQYYAGGIVGWASGNHQYINCDIDAYTTIGGQWGDFGNSNGGIIGGAGKTAKIYMKDCNVACRIDAVNDVVSAYQYYAYRCCGMLIGNTNNSQVINEIPYAAAPNLICENVNVFYGNWMNYHYCEFAGTGYPYVRVEHGVSVEAYSNIRYGHPTDANGNTVVDHNHAHNDGEDHHICLPFDQLLGGGPNGDGRNPVYGLAEFPGVTVVYPAEYTCPTCGQQHNVK